MKDLIRERLSSLRREMERENIDVLFISGLDENLSSSSDPYYDVIGYFTLCSSCTEAALLVYQKKAFLFADSRSIENIKNNIDTEFFTSVLSDDFDSPEDAALSFSVGYPKNRRHVMAFDDKTIPYHVFRRHFKAESLAIKVVDLVSKVWKDRPPKRKYLFKDVESLYLTHQCENEKSMDPVFERRAEKLCNITDFLEERENIDAVLFFTPNEISWLLNIKAYNGDESLLAPAALLVQSDRAFLFTDADIEPSALEDFKDIDKENLQTVQKVSVFDFNSLSSIISSLLPQNAHLAISGGILPLSIIPLFAKNKFISMDLLNESPSVDMATKPYSEVLGMRKAHIDEGAAYIRFLYKLSNSTLENEEAYIDSLIEEKKKIKSYIKESFSPIAAFGANGKCPHYCFQKGESAEVKGSGLMVFDTGSQYECGTTDVTRTLLIGDEIKNEWKRDYTIVLKAHLKAIMSLYKKNQTNGNIIDAVARTTMWKYGYDYEHSTGHGIETAGRVHAFIPRISPKKCFASEYIIEPNMMFSIEPGLYSKEDYAIRIENIVQVKKHPELEDYMMLQSVTLIPYETRLIDKELLSEEMVEYINNYHENIYTKLSRALDEEEKEFLKNITMPI